MIASLKFVRKIRRRREIHRITQAVNARPTPRNYEALCERLLAARGPQAALSTVGEACELFPWSERLQILARKIRRACAQAEVSALEDSVARAPSPEAYGRLAERLRCLGEDDEAIRYCWECAARFPQSENAYLVEGRLRADRAHLTGSVREGRLAIELLERAVALNPENMNARRRLAELYSDIRAMGHAKLHLEYLAAHAGEDDFVSRTLRKAAGAAAPEEEDLDVLLRDARCSGALASRSAFGERVAVVEKVADELSSMREVADLAVVEFAEDDPRNSRRARAETSADGEAEDLEQLAILLAGLAQGSLVEMDMGNFRHGEISGRWGSVMLFRLGRRGLAVRTDNAMASCEISEKVLSVPAADSHRV